MALWCLVWSGGFFYRCLVGGGEKNGWVMGGGVVVFGECLEFGLGGELREDGTDTGFLVTWWSGWESE